MTEGPPLNPQDPKRTGHRWLDLAVALFALLISSASIFVAYQSNQSMERLVRAGSWPFLQLGSGNVSDDGERQIAFAVSNVGTGPARIHDFEVKVDGAALPQEGHLLTNVLRACCDAEFRAAVAAAGGDVVAIYGDEVSSPVSRRFLAPNDDVTAMRWPRSDTNAALWAALDTARQTGRITQSVCYCSVFDDCWVARSDAFPPEEVNSCESAALQTRRD
ncbi:MAG: hypothetical protein AB7O98_05430 [Hyphomonadaceae bacterium]